MDNSIYISLSRQLALFRDMTSTANNIANASTPGYTAEKMMFTNYLVDDGNKHKMAFAQDISTYRDTSNGPMKETGGAFDLGINGPGYFKVETALGTRYTKAGNFTLGPDGMLMNPSGQPVLSIDDQRIFFEDTDKDITIGENGMITVTTPAGATEERGQVALVEFEDEQKMERLNGQLFKTDQEALPPAQARILQGVLETSNVSAITELIRTTELSRNTTNTAKFIEVIYDLERRTSNVYAKTQQS